jgi:hypothetical protein
MIARILLSIGGALGAAVSTAAAVPPPGEGGLPAADPVIRDGETLIRALHARYAAHWYRSLSFKQTVIRSGAAADRPPEIWVEYAEIPGRLRIDFDGGASGNGVLYLGDSLYVFRADTVARRLAQRNPLMLLGFDMYVQPPEHTLEVLRAEGFDLARFHQTEWQGRAAYVVGADPGDLTSPQFWVEAERLLFVRLIQPAGPDRTRTSDIRFNRYEPIAGGWIAPEVVFLLDGEEVMREKYFDMEADVDLDPRLWDPARWGEMRTR